MPQITLEYTTNAPQREGLQDLLAKIHRILAEVGGIKIGNCKSRARACETYHIAGGEPSGAFVHLEVRILEGRTPEVKQKIGESLLKALVDWYGESGADNGLQLTVEIQDIILANYFKHPSGSFTPQP